MSSDFIQASALILLCPMSVIGDLILASVGKLAVDIERRALHRMHDLQLLNKSSAAGPLLEDVSFYY